MVRRTEILQFAGALIAVSGLRTSLQDIADAAGIQAGSLYHHFESKEAILVELLRRYREDLDRIAAQAESRLDDPRALSGAVARSRFGRKGFEFTSIRDIASVAGLGIGTVYRLIGSKDQLLADIMRTFGEKMAPGWTGVLQSDSSPLEKIDAMSWIHTNVLDRFGDEFRIQLAWMRQSPPDTPSPGWLFSTRVSQMKSLLAEGIRSGEINIDSPSDEMLARAVIAVGWIPENILRALGTRASLVHVRDTSLRGASRR